MIKLIIINMLHINKINRDKIIGNHISIHHQKLRFLDKIAGVSVS